MVKGPCGLVPEKSSEMKSGSESLIYALTNCESRKVHQRPNGPIRLFGSRRGLYVDDGESW